MPTVVANVDAPSGCRYERPHSTSSCLWPRKARLCELEAKNILEATWLGRQADLEDSGRGAAAVAEGTGPTKAGSAQFCSRVSE